MCVSRAGMMLDLEDASMAIGGEFHRAEVERKTVLFAWICPEMLSWRRSASSSFFLVSATAFKKCKPEPFQTASPSLIL